ncbi:hypothetical protein D779_2773 [Imhoffiella purpurea]|uniref:Uncharacterized protein n=1 Tax=Imhoffiella purpurea TaxID=1249627 RepID=W9V449_9GAMM|nr:hypothetical protein D779_2773 [Imhoffiella purpurea]
MVSRRPAVMETTPTRAFPGALDCVMVRGDLIVALFPRVTAGLA